MPINIKRTAIIIVFTLGFLGCQSAKDVKKQQYFVEGLELYKTHCANCHQLDGAGLEGLYPPISQEYLRKNQSKVICTIQNGSADSLNISGKKYTQMMPANKQLQPLDIAEIMTFINNRWGGYETITEIAEVEEALKNCKK